MLLRVNVNGLSRGTPITPESGIFLQSNANPLIIYLVIGDGDVLGQVKFLHLGSLKAYNSLGHELTTAHYTPLKQVGELQLEPA